MTEIKFFYSPTCSDCLKLRMVLMGVLNSLNNVNVEEINVISQDGAEKANAYGIKKVPTILINGKVKLVGLLTSEELYKKIRGE